MVTTPREVEDALVSVGVPEDRARRIAHAVDRAENAATKGDLELESTLLRTEIRELRSEIKVDLAEHFIAIEKRFSDQDSRIARIEGRLDALEARVGDLAARFEAAEARNDQRHRQLMLAVLGIGATLIGMGFTGLLRLFEVI